MSDEALRLLARLFDYVMIQEGGFKDVELANEIAAFLPPLQGPDVP